MQTEKRACENQNAKSYVRKFQSKWLTIYSGWSMTINNIMYCYERRKISAKNSMVLGCQNFRITTLDRHKKFLDHNKAMIAPLQENMTKALDGANLKSELDIMIAIKTVFFMATNNIPLSLFPNTMEFLQHLKVPDTDALIVGDKVDYANYWSTKDFFDILSNLIDQQISSKAQASPIVTNLTNESTDITVHHKLTINIRLVNSTSLQPPTYFLTDVNLECGTGKAIYEATKSELQVRKSQWPNYMAWALMGPLLWLKKTGPDADHAVWKPPYGKPP